MPRDSQPDSGTATRSAYTIRTALLAFVLVPFLAILVLAGGYSLYNLEQQAAANMEEEIELIARAIRLPLSHALEQGQMDMIQQTLTSTQDFNRVYGVYIYDENGQRLASSGTKEASVQNEKAAELASTGFELSEFDEAAGEPVFSYFVPLTNSGERIIGLLQVTRRGKDFSSYVAEFRSRAIGIVALSALLLIVAVYFGYHYAVGRHMHRMRLDMQRITDGDHHQRLQKEGPAEFRVLASGVNSMLDSMVASEKEIAERREKEFELKRELYQAEKLAAIGRLAAGVAHELGTPLSVADGQAQRALRSAAAKESESFQKIRQQLARMTHIIRQLMNFARPSKPDKRHVAVDELVQSSLLQVEAASYPASVSVTGSEPAPRVWADRLRLEQAVTNLVRNALQANPEGRIHIGWSTDEGWLKLDVEDDGPGISEDARERLFDPFFTTKTTGEGTGLGLSVVEAVAQEHQGFVTCGTSTLGGALFRLSIPLAPEATSTPAENTRRRTS